MYFENKKEKDDEKIIEKITILSKNLKYIKKIY